MIAFRFLHSVPPLMAVNYCVKFLYFQKYAPDKLFIAKIKKRRSSVNTGDMLRFLHSAILRFCDFPHGPLSVYQVSLNYLQ